MAFPTGWGRKCPVTIDNTKVSGSANHSNFPVLLTEDNLPSEMFDADGSYPARSDGGDIRFSSDDAGTTELAREIVEFTTDNDPANGTAQIWVKVPTLDYNDDTVIYVWYNASSETEPASDSTYGSENTWNSNYMGVWHMEGANQAGITDSTGNSNDTDNSGGTPVYENTGKIDNGVLFASASSEFLEVPDSTSLSPTDKITLQCWTKLTTDVGGTILSKRDNPNYAWELNTEVNEFRFRVNGNANLVDSTTNPTAGVWYMLSATYDKDAGSNQQKIYVNGSNEASSTYSTAINDNSVDVAFAKRSYVGAENYFNGEIDEIRILNVDLDADWIATEYANQNSPSTFSEAGTPEDAGGASSFIPKIIMS